MEEKRNRVNGNIRTEQDKNIESLGFEPSYRRIRIQTEIHNYINTAVPPLIYSSET
jgi:hypothetical protein